MAGGYHLYNRFSDGFNIHQMTSSLPPCPQFEVSLSKEQKRELQDFISQPFKYIGKGCQFYAFESADGKVVLKFLKHKHLRPFTWLKSIPMPLKLREICDEKIARRKARVKNLFSSCKLAYEEMPEETGLLFVHLNRVPALEKEVVLIDKLGLKHRVLIDDYEYVLQKRATSVKDVFSQILSEKELRMRIEQLIVLVTQRWEKGIADRDRSFVQNVAFCEKGAIFVDTGQFYKDPGFSLETDMRKRLSNLRGWAERHFPDYLPVIDSYLN